MLLVAARPDLREQHAEAFDDDQRLAELVASLPRVDEAWLARLQDEVTQLACAVRASICSGTSVTPRG